MKLLKKMYQKSKEQKGFTLVEMIVVLVIIAILAAITVPALLKYIDKAKEKQVLVNARTAYLAAETAAAEAYAAGYTAPSTFKFTDSGANETTDNTTKKVELNAKGLAGSDMGYYTCEVTVNDKWEISKVEFKSTSDSGHTKVLKTATLNVETSGTDWEVK